MKLIFFFLKKNIVCLFGAVLSLRSAHGLFLVAMSWGYFSLWYTGFSLSGFFCCQAHLLGFSSCNR